MYLKQLDIYGNVLHIIAINVKYNICYVFSPLTFNPVYRFNITLTIFKSKLIF